MIVEERVGQVVPPGDPDALERMILAYVQNPALAAEQGKRARRAAETKYSKQAACRRYTEVLGG
jgi:glycosyltransferase involved in cell wall biosynthesis